MVHIYKLYKTDGSVEDIHTLLPIHLEKAQELLGESVEPFEQDGRALLCNNEGKLLGLPENPHFSGVSGNVIEGGLSEVDDDEEEPDFIGLVVKHTADDVGRYLTLKLRERGHLDQSIAARDVQLYFGDEFVYLNENDRLAISPGVLKAFKTHCPEKEWDRRNLRWEIPR